MAKWTAEEKAKAGQRRALVCPNVTRRTKDRIAQSKRARAGSLATVDNPQVARTCILRTFLFADAILSISRVTFIFSVLFCFVFVFLLSLKPRPFVQSLFVLRYACYRPDNHTQLANNCSVIFCVFRDIPFSECV